MGLPKYSLIPTLCIEVYTCIYSWVRSKVMICMYVLGKKRNGAAPTPKCAWLVFVGAWVMVQCVCVCSVCEV